MSKSIVRRDVPVPGTHLTEMQLTEMWYQHCEAMNPNSLHRAHGRLFPRSRKDLIEYYTKMDLANGAGENPKAES